MDMSATGESELYSDLDKRLLGVFFIFGKWLFSLGGDLAKRLLGVEVIWLKDSLVLIQPWHQGVFGPDHPFEREDNTLKHTLKAI